MVPFPTTEPNNHLKWHVLAAPFTALAGLTFSISFGNANDSSLTNLRIGTITAVACVLHHCIMGDCERHRQALCELLNKNIVNITYYVTTFAMIIGAYCFAESFIIEGESLFGVFSLIFCAAMAHYIVYVMIGKTRPELVPD